MIRLHVAGGVLTAAVLAAIPACAATQPSTAAPSPAATTATPAPAETLSPLLEQALPNVDDKTFTSAIVSFPPSARAVPHRHGGAFVYAYVLEGNVSSKLNDEHAHTFHQGENWVEQPGAHHVITENVSSTEPARLLVVFISSTGDELKIDDPH